MKKTLLILGSVIVVAVLGVMLLGRESAEKPVQEGLGSRDRTFEALYQSARRLDEEGELLAAKDAYQELLMKYAYEPGVEEIQSRIEVLNMNILFSGLRVPQSEIYEIKSGDSLYKIAKKFKTTVPFIKKQNGLTSDVIRPGSKLRIWTGTFSVMVDKSQNILVLKSDGEVLKNYRISTGKGNITPVGTFKIANRLKNPSWHHGGKVISAADPANILGTRWLGFDEGGYGIHGTTEPETIGTQVTAGCVRMLNRQVEELFDILPVGTEVMIID